MPTKTALHTNVAQEKIPHSKRAHLDNKRIILPHSIIEPIIRWSIQLMRCFSVTVESNKVVDISPNSKMVALQIYENSDFSPLFFVARGHFLF